MSVYAGLVAAAGLSDAHRLIVEAVPAGSRVLDVGCAEGHLAEALTAGGCVVSAVEADAAAARAARERCAEVWCLDVEDALARAVVPGGYDAVVLADVLEHLRDPWAALAWAASLLRANGVAVVSIPNAVVWHARRQVAFGRFPMEDWGTFDRTHLRWFTLDGVRRLVRDAGLEVERERFTPSALPLQARLPATLAGSSRLAGLRRALAARFPGLFALQFVLIARRPRS